MSTGSADSLPPGDPNGPVLLFDGDCGFCQKAAALAPRLRLSVNVQPMQSVDLPALGVDEQRAERELPFVEADGSVAYGHRAVAAALRTGGPVARGAGRLLDSELLAKPMAAAYRWTARNRQSLPGSSSACAIPPGSPDR